GRGEENGRSFIQLEQSSGVTNLSIWYPEQAAGEITPYPWTIEQLTGDNATVENVTLVNSYNGIKIGPVWNELHYIHNLYGTTLKTGIFLDYTTDIGRLEGIRLSPDYWSNSGLAGAPARPELLAYMTTHAEGIVMGRSDWEYMSDVHISGYQTGMRITTRTGSLETANAQLYGIHIDSCNVALKIEGVNDYGLLISNSEFLADAGDNPMSIYATSGFHSIVQFNTVTVGGNPRNAVVNEGTGVISFENSTIANWDHAGGAYAIKADAGSVILGQTGFGLPDHHLSLGKSVEKVNTLNSGYEGELDIKDDSDAADLNVHQNGNIQLKTMPADIQTDIAVQPKPAASALFDVTAAPYNADKQGMADVSAAVKQALADAAGTGGTVYFPAGTYRINEALTVPSGVELRGSWDVPHHTIGGGSVIFTNYGENAPDGDAFITLESSSGIRGISVYYDEQDWSSVKPYAWTIRGKGHDVYAINTTLVNPYQGIDFGSYDTSGHYIDYVAGSPLKEGIYLGGGASGGIMRNVQFNPHYYSRSTYPNHVPGEQQDVVWNYQKENLDAFRIGHTEGETIFNTFVYGSQYGIHFVAQDGVGPEAVVLGHGTDGSKKGVFVEAAGDSGLTFINTELVSMSTSDKVYITVDEGFDSEATFFNTSMWGDTTRSVDALSGKVNLQQSNFTVSGARGVNALGGEITLYDSYFQQAGSTHIYAGPDIVALREGANLFQGGIKLEDHSGGKVSGTDLTPVALELSKKAVDPAHPEEWNHTLTLRNVSQLEPMKGRIELMEPVQIASKWVPVRFEGVGYGESLTFKL
ncbi:glycoside hydrolase family 55 protein, partial [Paenibacillus sepulcri]|nr:glycoside hydrolase family 55 protein [Paenibacillus sepulcri]